MLRNMVSMEHRDHGQMSRSKIADTLEEMILGIFRSSHRNQNNRAVTAKRH